MRKVNLFWSRFLKCIFTALHISKHQFKLMFLKILMNKEFQKKECYIFFLFGFYATLRIQAFQRLYHLNRASSSWKLLQFFLKLKPIVICKNCVSKNNMTTFFDYVVHHYKLLLVKSIKIQVANTFEDVVTRFTVICTAKKVYIEKSNRDVKCEEFYNRALCKHVQALQISFRYFLLALYLQRWRRSCCTKLFCRLSKHFSS